MHKGRCSECGYTETTGIEKKEHIYEHVVEAAELLKDDREYDKCSVCGAVINEVIIDGYATLYVSSQKVAPASKAMTVSWKKQSSANQKKFGGYIIEYSTDKTFATGVKSTTATKTSSSKKISKLTSKKTYYVRIRTYTVKDGKKYYSKWCTVKSAKIK